MKKVKKIITTGALFSTLAFPMVAQAANVTVSVGNGSFSSYASSDYLGASVKSVTGISTSKSNISEVTSQAASGTVIRDRKTAHSYRGGLSSQSSYSVVNSGTSANGAYKTHTQKV